MITKQTMIGIPLVAVLAGGAYAGKFWADSTYVRQDVFVAQQRESERRQIQRMMVPLIVREKQNALSDADQVRLETYRQQLQELER